MISRFSSPRSFPMENSSAIVNGSESSSLLPPPSRPAADPVTSESGATAGPSKFDDLEKSMDAPNIDTPKPKPKPTLAERLESLVSDLPNIRERIHKLSDVPELRERVRAALKLAPNPADLVYECSKNIKDGQTYVLFMELFLRMVSDGDGEVPMNASPKHAAYARRWMNKYHACGGCEEDHRIQARGLLFFVASFGIPAGTDGDYIMNLIILSYPCDISETLKQSRVLVPMIPDIIKKMLQYKLYGEAIDVVFTFGIADEFPPQQILDSFEVEYEEALTGLSRYGSGKKLEKAAMDLKNWMCGEAIDVVFNFGIEDKFSPQPTLASLEGDKKRASTGLCNCGSVQELENAVMDIENKVRTVAEALKDHKFCGLESSWLRAMHRLIIITQEYVKEIREVRRGLKSNDAIASADDGKKKMEMERDEMDTGTEHLPLARRLKKSHALRKLKRTEPIICYLLS